MHNALISRRTLRYISGYRSSESFDAVEVPMYFSYKRSSIGKYVFGSELGEGMLFRTCSLNSISSQLEDVGIWNGESCHITWSYQTCWFSEQP